MLSKILTCSKEQVGSKNASNEYGDAWLLDGQSNDGSLPASVEYFTSQTLFKINQKRKYYKLYLACYRNEAVIVQ